VKQAPDLYLQGSVDTLEEESTQGEEDEDNEEEVRLTLSF
jgi:hypothetical protein